MAETELLGIALVIVFAVGSQLLAAAIRIPAILILLAAGFLAGGMGWIDPDELFGDLFYPMVSVAVGVILFLGGLNLHFADLRGGVRPVVLRLLTIGVGITWAAITVATYYIFDLKFSSSVLVGAVLVVTGPTVVIPMLDFIRPTPRVRSVLRWEGIIIDPIGAILAVLTFHALTAGADEDTLQRIVEFVVSIGCGVGVGLIGALVMMALLGSRLTTGRQDATATLMVVVAAVAAGNLLRDDTGLISTTVMGIVLANQKRVETYQIVEFKETLGLLLLGVLFVTLAAQVSLESMLDLGWGGLAFCAILMLLVRPLEVAICTVGSNLDMRERAFMAWMAPRGIVAASVASTFALRLDGVDAAAAEKIVPITFLVILVTVAIYGLTAPQLARRLGLTKGKSSSLLMVGADPWARKVGSALAGQGIEVTFWTSRSDEAAAAQQEGLRVREDRLLRDSAADGHDLDVTHALMVTDVDAFNSLAAAALADEVGRPYVFQLPPDKEGQVASVTSELRRATELWKGTATFSELKRRFDSGAQLVVDSPQNESECHAFIAKAEHGTMPLFVIGTKKDVTPVSSDGVARPRPGDTVISLV